MRGPMGEVPTGRDQLRTHLSDWQDGLTDVEIVVDRMAVDGAAVVVDWHFHGRHTGVALLMEDMLFDPTGNQVTCQLTERARLPGATASARSGTTTTSTSSCASCGRSRCAEGADALR